MDKILESLPPIDSKERPNYTQFQLALQEAHASENGDFEFAEAFRKLRHDLEQRFGLGFTLDEKIAQPDRQKRGKRS